MKKSKAKELSILRHSAAHLAAQAIVELFPGTLLTIGPATKEGFFYDVLPTTNLRQEDLPIIEEKMHELSKKNLPITHEEIPKSEGRKLFADNPFKLELIDQIPGETVGLSAQGDFIDLCRGGHVASTGDIKYFKLTGLSGSYWRADKENQALQRISGTAFLSQEDMDIDQQKKEEAQKYDHRRLGKQLDLFSFHQEGVGFPFYHPKGKTIVNELKSYLRGVLDKQGYQEISTPVVLSDELWHRSGHYDHYKDNMYFTEIDEKTSAIRPMNCPGAMLVYKERPRSYRELPLRFSEFGLVHRYELSGVLHGLFRVRSFTQDDSHIFCMPDQIEQEITNLIELFYQVYNKFAFSNIHVAISTRPKKAMGSVEIWDKAINSLKASLNKANIPYTICEGDGAFYGPKIDFYIKDSMDREWQCGTIQLDFFQPENFDLHYVASDGTKKRPVVIHRAIYGSLERFFGILLEHFKGNLPLWLAPIQMKVLTITDEQLPYAQQLLNKLKEVGYRVQLDISSDPISGKIKSAQLEKVPWMLVIGNKEVEGNTITLRRRDGKQEFGLTLDELLSKAESECS